MTRVKRSGSYADEKRDEFRYYNFGKVNIIKTDKNIAIIVLGVTRGYLEIVFLIQIQLSFQIIRRSSQEQMENVKVALVIVLLADPTFFE